MHRLAALVATILLAAAPARSQPAMAELEPNDDWGQETLVAIGTVVSGDAGGSLDSFAFDVTEAGHAYRLALSSPEWVELTLYEGDRTRIATRITRDVPDVFINGLDLAPGRYIARLSARVAEVAPYTLALVDEGPRPPGGEIEPNDGWTTATALVWPQSATGIVDVPDDRDYFAFTVDGDSTGSRYEIAVEIEAGRFAEIALLAADGRQLVRHFNVDEAVFPDLQLSPGTYGIMVRADAPAGTGYEIEIDRTGRADPALEAEPNNDAALATPIDPATNRIDGQIVGGENDFFLFQATGTPQLWRIQANGGGDLTVELLDQGGHTVLSQRADRLARLSNVLLLPGAHTIRVTSTQEVEYTLRLIPLGPPPPGMEQEPNDAVGTEKTLELGLTSRGLIAENNDTDGWQFAVLGEDRLRLSFAPPADAELRLRLIWDGAEVFRTGYFGGETYVYDAMFRPGDYRVVIEESVPADSQYTLLLERLDPLDVPVDLEPNESHDADAMLPADHRLVGVTASNAIDVDVWRLPDRDVETTLLIHENRAGGATMDVLNAFGGGRIQPRRNADGVLQAILPPSVELYLAVGNRNPATIAGVPYDLTLEFNPGPAAIDGAVPADAPVDPAAPARDRYGRLDASLAFAAEAPRPAAYLPQAQRFTLPLTITAGAAAIDAELIVHLTHHAWSATLSQPTVSLAAGGSATIDVTVTVPPDAWADQAVRLAMGTLADGRIATANIDIVPDRDALPLAAAPDYHQVPEAMRGGVNVAWAGLGAEWVVDPEGTNPPPNNLIPWFNDGMTTLRDTFSYRLDGTADYRPTLRLAGDHPVMLAGVQIHPHGDHPLAEQLRHFAIEVSLDGVAFDRVLEGELSAAPVEQSFAFDQPVAAAFIRLVMHDTFGTREGGTGTVSIGEFKAIAVPGSNPFDHPLNLAQGLIGGHVVWADPVINASNWDAQILSTADEGPVVNLAPTATATGSEWRASWVVGFHHDRAAQITGLTWRDSDRTNVAARFDRVTIAVSTAGPVGPWSEIGTWDLPGADAARALAIDFDVPVWARYVRFDAAATNPAGNDRAARVGFPEELRILEAPADESYRSILGAWGHYAKAAIFEALNPAPIVAAHADDNDTIATAEPLTLGEVASGYARLDEDVDWYRVTVPAGANTLRLELGGDATIGVGLRLTDATGAEIALRAIVGPPAIAGAGERQLYEAAVTGGETYYVELAEPPWNLLFIWDNSGSMTTYLPGLYAAVADFARDVRPNQNVNLMPFRHGMPLLDAWTDDPLVLLQGLNDYARDDGSSDAEGTLYDAAQELGLRAGAKAVVMITDAATNRTPEVWNALAEVRPQVFTVQVGSTGTLGLIGGSGTLAQDLMQSWSNVNDGFYAYPRTYAEMEIAYDRAAVFMRRAKPYLLLATAETIDIAPGTLQVTGGAAGAVTEIVLDGSGSMLQRIDNQRRIDIAKDVVIDLLANTLRPGTPFAFRAFGHRNPDECYTDLQIPVGPLTPALAMLRVQAIEAKNLARTPIGDALAGVSRDLAGVDGEWLVILITDGEETCDGDAAAEIVGMLAAHPQTRVQIVGFAIADPALQATFTSWAGLGNGRYFDAGSRAQLEASVREALRPSYQVLDATGTVVATGVSGGTPHALPPGTYSVRVATLPATVIENVVVRSAQAATVTLGD